jgi:propanol-preferring alcohol dehydrogenase
MGHSHARPGQILVKTEACGVCHTDLHAANGDWPLKPTLPFIPGHEASAAWSPRRRGRDDRQGRRPRRRAVALFGLRSLRILPEAWETVCARRSSAATPRTAASPNTSRRSELRRPYPGRSRREGAAPLICAGITTYKGIKETEAKARRMDRHLRRGGLGHLAIQYAKAMGLQVCAVDIDDGKLAHAKKLGADLVVNAKTGDPAPP